MTDAKQQAPDELVERVALTARRVWVGFKCDDLGRHDFTWRDIARAVLAEIAAAAPDMVGVVYERGALKKRVAELEAELAELGALLKRGVDIFGADDTRIKTLEEESAKLKEESDGLRVELAEAREQRDSLDRRWANIHEHDVNVIESQNAELRLLFAIEKKVRGTWSPEHELLKALDTHRAETSADKRLADHASPAPPVSAQDAVSGSAVDTGVAPNQATSGHLYETAPRLTKGVRYRVVEASPDAYGNPKLPTGHEFMAAGVEWLGEPSVLTRKPGGQLGWYCLGPDELGWYRVVRVEPEKAPLPGYSTAEDCGQDNDDCKLWEGGGCVKHDGGGERSGQAYASTLSAERDAREHAFPCCGGSDEHPPEHTQDCSRAGQAEDAIPPGHLDKVASMLKGGPGPHTATVALHEKRLTRAELGVERFEAWLMMDRSSHEIQEEIRAERAGRKDR